MVFGLPNVGVSPDKSLLKTAPSTPFGRDSAFFINTKILRQNYVQPNNRRQGFRIKFALGQEVLKLKQIPTLIDPLPNRFAKNRRYVCLNFCNQPARLSDTFERAGRGNFLLS